MEKELTIGGIFREGIPLGIKNAVSIVGAYILWLLTFWIPYLNVGTTIGLVGIIAAISKGDIVSSTDIFNPKYRKYMGEFFLVTIFLSVGCTIGLTFMVIPGIVIAIAWGQAVLLVLDKGINPIKALTVSNDITYGKKATIFFGALLVGIACNVVFVILLVTLSIIPFLFFRNVGIFTLVSVPCFIVVSILFNSIMIGIQAYIYSILAKDVPNERIETSME